MNQEARETRNEVIAEAHKAYNEAEMLLREIREKDLAKAWVDYYATIEADTIRLGF